MVRDLRIKLERLETLFSKLPPPGYQNELCSMVTPWKADFKIFKEVISDKKNKEKLKYFNNDENVLRWLEDVKTLADDVQEILDKIVIIGKASSRKRSIFACCRNPVADTAFDTRQIDDASKRIHALKKRMKDTGLQVRYKHMTCRRPELCKSAGLSNSGVFYGRDITDESHHGNFSIMPIIGMAGIGKTSLTRLVYDDEAVEDFKPEDSNVSRISKATLESITSKSCNLEDINDLAATILAGLLCALNGEMNDKANVMGDPVCFKEEKIGGSEDTKFNWSKAICVF